MKRVRSFSEYLEDNERVSFEEREIINIEKELIIKMAEIREAEKYSQRDLSRISGIKQPAIARMESLHCTPQIDTLLKLLIPMGYTLAIVPLKR